MIPPKHPQYQLIHCPGACAAAFCTAAPCAFRYANTDGGTLEPTTKNSMVKVHLSW